MTVLEFSDSFLCLIDSVVKLSNEFFISDIIFFSFRNSVSFYFNVSVFVLNILHCSCNFSYICLLCFLLVHWTLQEDYSEFFYSQFIVLTFFTVVIVALLILFCAVVCPWFLLILFSLHDACIFEYVVMSSRVYKFAEKEHHKSVQAAFLDRLVGSVHGWAGLAAGVFDWARSLPTLWDQVRLQHGYEAGQDHWLCVPAGLLGRLPGQNIVWVLF